MLVITYLTLSPLCGSVECPLKKKKVVQRVINVESAPPQSVQWKHLWKQFVQYKSWC